MRTSEKSPVARNAKKFRTGSQGVTGGMDAVGPLGLHQIGETPAGVATIQATANAVASTPRTATSNTLGTVSGKHSAIGGGGMWSRPERVRAVSAGTPARNMPVDELDDRIVGMGWVV